MKLFASKSFSLIFLHSINHFSILIMLSLFLTHTAQADCVGRQIVFQIPDLSFNLNNIPLYGKIGSEIITPEQVIGHCAETQYPILAQRTIDDPGGGSSLIMGKAIYPTSVPGIGYELALEPINFCTWAGIYRVPFTTCEVAVDGLNTTTFIAKLHLQLYRIGTISSAANITIFKNYFTIREYDSLGKSVISAYIHQSAIPFNISVRTCSLQSASISNINLPKISSNTLSNIGSRAGSTPFNLTVNCPSLTNLNITFTDNNNRKNFDTVLTPALSSTAQGVGIQLQYNGKIIQFGKDSAEPGITGQIVLNPNLIGTQTFPFTASYIRTGPLKPGSLTSTATFTLSYQ